MLNTFTGFTSPHDHVMVGQLHCLLMRMELQANRLTDSFDQALQVATVMGTISSKFASYPSFCNLYLKLLAELANFRKYESQMGHILQILEEVKGFGNN